MNKLETKNIGSKFSLIDKKLNGFSERQNAKIYKDSSLHTYNDISIPKEYIEDRVITWSDGLVSKAVIIKPSFDSTNFVSPKWNFVNLAWLAEDAPGLKKGLFWEKYLHKDVEFQVIEKNIDKLLESSKENLQKVRIEDLK